MYYSKQPSIQPSYQSPSPAQESTFERYENKLWTLSKFMATIGVVIGTILGLILIGFGFKTYQRQDPRMLKTSARIIYATCVQERKRPTCSLDIEYTVDEKLYQTKFKQTGRAYFKDEIIDIWCDPSNPLSFRTGPSNQSSGVIMIILGVALVAFSWLYYWFVSRNKEWGTILGVSALV